MANKKSSNKKKPAAVKKSRKVTFDQLVAGLDPKEIRAKLVEIANYQLDNVDRAILSMMVQYPGLSIKALGESMGYTREAMSRRVSKPAFKAALNDFSKSVMDLLVEGQKKAIRTLMKHCDHEDAAQAISAAKALVAPLNKIEGGPPIQQNLIYAIQFGDGGQIYKQIRPMDPDEQFMNEDAKELVAHVPRQ